MKYNLTYPPRSGSGSLNIEHVLGMDIFISIRNVNLHSLETSEHQFLSDSARKSVFLWTVVADVMRDDFCLVSGLSSVAALVPERSDGVE